MKNYRLAIVVISLVLTLGAARSWGQDPSTNDTSDSKSNTGGGSGALVRNTTGGFNTAYGQSALSTNTTASDNTAIGFEALANNTTGSGNTAIGDIALIVNTTGNVNTATGVQALGNNTTGSNNTAIGSEALLNVNNGGSNTAIGDSAGRNLTSGSNNIYLRSFGGTTESNTMRLGHSQTRTFISGIQATPVSGKQVFINSNGQLGILASSARYKRDIQTMGNRSRRLLQLRPVTFRYKQDPQGVQQYGLIAEEVAKVYPELVNRGAKGEVESVQYHELIPMLLNEMQHQQQALGAQARQLAQLKAENKRLQSELVEQNAALAARLQQLEARAARMVMLATR